MNAVISRHAHVEKAVLVKLAPQGLIYFLK